MATGHFIRDGDKTYCGGKVLAGNRGTVMNGMPHAREGDPVTCGKDGKVYEIVGGVNIIISNGKRPAGTLDSVSTCPCRARFISSLKHTYEKADKPSVQVPPPRANSAVPAQPPEVEKYARSFAITNSETGQPLSHRQFVALVDGRETSGVTDARGMAHVQAPSANSSIALHIVFSSPARILNELSEKGQ